jgi:alpha-D-ribose 1-methylphosphonate 5-triphosphate synthase subunit PhnG
MDVDAEVAAEPARRRWMGILAKAPPEELESAWAVLASPPRYRMLRRPEVGLVMVRGRMGGEGNPFNLGEVTVTRCSVCLEDGRVGHATVAGRSLRHAELAAVFDGLMQQSDRAAEWEAALIAPLERAQMRRRDEAARKTAATRVEFFTLVRSAGSP